MQTIQGLGALGFRKPLGFQETQTLPSCVDNTVSNDAHKCLLEIPLTFSFSISIIWLSVYVLIFALYLAYYLAYYLACIWLIIWFIIRLVLFGCLCMYTSNMLSCEACLDYKICQHSRAHIQLAMVVAETYRVHTQNRCADSSKSCAPATVTCKQTKMHQLNGCAHTLSKYNSVTSFC